MISLGCHQLAPNYIKGSFLKGHVPWGTVTIWPSWACIKRCDHYLNQEYQSFTSIHSIPFISTFNSMLRTLSLLIGAPMSPCVRVFTPFSCVVKIRNRPDCKSILMLLSSLSGSLRLRRICSSEVLQIIKSRSFSCCDSLRENPK